MIPLIKYTLFIGCFIDISFWCHGEIGLPSVLLHKLGFLNMQHFLFAYDFS